MYGASLTRFRNPAGGFATTADIEAAALPAIGAGLRLDEAELGWVTNAYLLAFGGCMLVGGRAVDLLGPRRVFGVGLAVFTGASALAGFAPSMWPLIAARALPGVGVAIVVPARPAPPYRPDGSTCLAR
ncbi:MFS transporter [Microtetraspora sp. NBRC 16547]|uniref:MFS transporter n=1 Tax=Microtetraspora sp. NBRC 16547 TaxID=3030993 RepID=UPI00255354F0|nr:MFS transporter [Microtetraspora sp. NBRC 16547]